MRYFRIVGPKNFQGLLDERDIALFVDELISMTSGYSFRKDTHYFEVAEKNLLEALLMYIRGKPDYQQTNPIDALSSLLEQMITPSYGSEDLHFVENEMNKIDLKSGSRKHPTVLKYRKYKQAASNVTAEVAASCHERIIRIVPETTDTANDIISEFASFFMDEEQTQNTDTKTPVKK